VTGFALKLEEDPSWAANTDDSGLLPALDCFCPRAVEIGEELLAVNESRTRRKLRLGPSSGGRYVCLRLPCTLDEDVP
jgi:hypothetical protein